MIAALKNIECITLFVEDLPAARAFYEKVFPAKLVFEDEHCAVMGLENLNLNLLQIAQAPELIEPATVANAAAGARLMFTILVPNVDETCRRLRELGVPLLNGPQDRPWGRRTAAFRDPAGNVWEIAH